MGRQKAFTLIEIMVASSILAAVMVVVMTLMHSFTTSTADQHRAVVLLQTGSRALEAIVDSLRPAKVTQADSTSQFVAFQTPVDPNNTGYLDANRAIRWGVYSPDTGGGYSDKLGDWAAYTFVPVFEFDEGEKGYDLNRDGDTDDVFEIGHIAKEYYAGSDFTDDPYASHRLTADTIVQLKDTPHADFLGEDGIYEDIFSYPGTTAVGVTLVVIDPEVRNPALARFSTVVELQNRL